MNIWYLNHYAGGPGLGRYARAFHLARVWTGLGHETTVFVARYHHLLDHPSLLPPEANVGGVRYVSLPARLYSGNGVGRLLNIADYCRAIPGLAHRVPGHLSKPDVVIVSTPHPFAIYAASRLCRRFGATLVFETRDLWSLSMVEANGASRFSPFTFLCRHAERFAYRSSDLVASLLPDAERHMRENGLRSGKFTYVPNGVDPEASKDASEPTSLAGEAAARQLAAWKQEGRVSVIHPGAQGAANALDRLLDAAVVLRSEGLGQEVGMLLVGTGSKTADLRAQAERLKLQNVCFVDQVPRAEALWLTSRSEIGYAGGRDHPTLYRHGISFNKVMDFMQVGLPVVLPVAAGSDPVTASGCGIVTGSDRPERIAGAIAELVGMGPEGRQEIGARGKDYVLRHFDYRRIGASYLAAMERVRASV